jgi:hypothetical protein
MKLSQAWPILLSTLLVCVGAIQTVRLGVPADAGPYLASVKRAVEQMPRASGPWRAPQDDEKIPRAARELLRPNAIMSRNWFNSSTGETFKVLFVHCADGRDMFAHYPPICYPNNGQKLTVNQPQEVEVDGKVFRGREYGFIPARLGEKGGMRIFNVIFLPDDLHCADMAEMRQFIMANNTRLYGAGQIQIIVPLDMPQPQRVELYRQALRVYLSVITAVGARPGQVASSETHP